MPNPPGLEGHLCPEGRAESGRGFAARAAEIPTKATNAHQSLQRLGSPKLQRLPARLDETG
jgi:hypothetical protein